MVKGLKSRLKLSNQDSDALLFALKTQELFEQCPSLPWSVLQPALVHPMIESAAGLLRCRARSQTGMQSTLDWLEERLRWPEYQLNPMPFLTGRDLTENGLKPSPQFKDLLARARSYQLDGELNTREEALAWLRTVIAPD